MTGTVTLHVTHVSRRIVVDAVQPSLPVRGFDYCACFDNYTPGEPQGFGATREQAIGALIDQVYPEEVE